MHSISLGGPAGPPSGSFGLYVAAFVREWRLGRFWRASVKRREVRAFGCWAGRRCIEPGEVNDAHVVEYFASEPPASGAPVSRRRAALDLFLQYLRTVGVSPVATAPTDATPAGVLLRRYCEYLRNRRGLTERSICVYLPYVREFVRNALEKGGTSVAGDLDAEAVRAFFLARVRGRPPAYTHLVASALRSFLRFLFLRSATALDLSRAIPRIRRWRQAGVPSFLSPPEVDRVLRSPDRATPTGRRDYAILLLLARLGLRAGEVAALELGDVRWRDAEIVVRAKGRSLHNLPLPRDVGQALARYIRRDRSPSTSRRLFLRRIPPHVGLAGPAAIGHIVRLALVRAGLRTPGRRGAAHLFRHSLATRMIRQGATIPEIAEILGHRSLGTTEIYAKVDFETLRGVARPWPSASVR